MLVHYDTYYRKFSQLKGPKLCYKIKSKEWECINGIWNKKENVSIFQKIKNKLLQTNLQEK